MKASETNVANPAITRHQIRESVQQMIISGQRQPGTKLRQQGLAPLDEMTEKVPYDPARDVAFFTGDGPSLPLKAGGFMIFFPHDAHMPRIEDGTAAPLRKVVVKVAT